MSREPVKFLLVYDLDENLQALGTFLRRDGLELLQARSGAEALELLLRHEVALAIVDMQMPGLDGFALAEMMRETERNRSLPIIFVTAGAVDVQRPFRGYEAGAVDFVYKPIERQILRSKAEIFFDLSNQKRELAAQRDELVASVNCLEAVKAELKQEIAERMRAEEALRRREEMFRSIYSSNMVPMALWKKSGRLLGANDAMLKMLGYTIEEMNAGIVNWEGITPAEYHERDLKAIAEVDARGFCMPYEKCLRNKDEHLIPILIGGGQIYGSEGLVVFFAVDLTARKQAEAEVRAQHDLLATIFERMPAAINIIRGSELRLIMVNPGYRAIAPGKGDPVGKTLDEIWPETGQNFSELCRQVLETGQPYHALNQLNMIRRKPDGPLEPAWFTWSLHRIRLPGEDGWGIFNPAWETTAQVEVEKTLRESEERLAFLLKLTDILRPLDDPYEVQESAMRTLGEYLQVSGAFYWEVDLDDTEYMNLGRGHSIEALEVPSRIRVSDYGKAILKAYLQGLTVAVNDWEKDPRVDQFRRAAFGAKGIAAFVGVPLVKNGMLTTVLGIYHSQPREWTSVEISLLKEFAERTWAAVERRRAEKALRESEKKYRELFESIDEGFCIIEVIFDKSQKAADYCFLELNSTFQRQTGLSEAHGRRIRELYPAHEEHWFDIYGHIALTGEATRFQNEAAQLGRWYDVYAWRYGLPQDRQVAVLFNDITERKKNEEELKKLNDELERRVELRTRDLQETQSHLLHAEKLSTIGRMSASIAHEFNNPLQGVMTILKGFQKTLALEEQDRVLLDLAFSESERMKNLIRNLQDFNRPSTGRKVFMDVHATIDSLILLSKSDLKRKDISIILNYGKTLPQILAIPDQIKQVIINLLQNAADACNGNNGVITISTCHEGERIAVAIQDNGIGIAPNKFTQIFQPFYTTKPEVKGTGLGLSICHGIVENHQGEIRVESAPGKGSTFTVLLPIVGESK